MKKILAFLCISVLWLTFGRAAHDTVLGEFTREFPDQHHEPFATEWGYMGGPFSFLVATLSGDGGKPMSKGYTCEQRWQNFQMSSSLSHYYFSHWGGNTDCIDSKDEPKEN